MKHIPARIAASVALALALAGVGVLISIDRPDSPTCAELLQQAEYTSDVATELTEQGCVEPSGVDGR